jgi:hypothetical protein
MVIYTHQSAHFGTPFKLDAKTQKIFRTMFKVESFILIPFFILTKFVLS